MRAWMRSSCPGDHRVDQTRTGVRADMHLHAEVPLVALLGLMHFRVALAVLILGRGWRPRTPGRKSCVASSSSVQPSMLEFSQAYVA